MNDTSAGVRTRGHLLSSDAELARLLASCRTIAVLGIRSESSADKPAHYVPRAAQAAGYRILPVPVYEPDVTSILGEPVHRSVAALDAAPDLVDVFRRPSDLNAHLPDLLAARPRAVWLQSGIRDDSFAEALLAAGIDVVQDRCLMVEIQRFGARPPA